MKPPKTIYVHKYAAHIFAEKEDRSNTVEYSLKGEDLRSLKKAAINHIKGHCWTYHPDVEWIMKAIERRLK